MIEVLMGILMMAPTGGVAARRAVEECAQELLQIKPEIYHTEDGKVIVENEY